MYNIDWHITIGSYKLLLLDSAEIHASVDLLSDTATIELPATNLNKKLDVESKIKLGDKVKIEMGYNGDLLNEFEGYIERIGTDDGGLTLYCEDGLYLTRVEIADKVLKKVTVKDVVDYVASQIGGLTVVADFEFTYEKFIISRVTGYDVLKKIQEETSANIYMLGNELHAHYPYTEMFGEVTYDFARNIENSDLTYKRADERKYQIEVESIGNDGKRIVEVVGTPGGDKRSIKVHGVTDPATLRTRGEAELSRLVYDGYEGSITCWLLPVCRPGYSAKIVDADYPEKEGGYYVVAVTTSISQGGGVRKVQLGKRLS